MKCIFHLGPPKTGSTSIQAFLRQNKAVLRERNILALTDDELDRKLPFFFRKKIGYLTTWAKQMGLDREEKRAALRANTDEYIRDQIRMYQPEKLVLSCENLARISAADAKKMRDYLGGLASEIKIVFFLRRQDFLVLSGYKNRVRNRGLSEEISSEYQPQFDDARNLKRLAKHFGRDAMYPVICQDSHPGKADADSHYEAFLKVLFEDEPVSLSDYKLPERKNAGWDYKAINYMREFNKLAEKAPELARHRVKIGSLLQQNFSGGEKPKIKRSVAEAIVANYRSSWEDIRKLYFPNQKELFNTDFSMYDEDTSDQKFGAEEAVYVSLVLFGDLLKGESKK